MRDLRASGGACSHPLWTEATISLSYLIMKSNVKKMLRVISGLVSVVIFGLQISGQAMVIENAKLSACQVRGAQLVERGAVH